MFLLELDSNLAHGGIMFPRNPQVSAAITRRPDTKNTPRIYEVTDVAQSSLLTRSRTIRRIRITDGPKCRS
jgi:hypothetical protein